MTPAGIEPATFRFVAQHLNHCATAVPIQWVVGAILLGLKQMGCEYDHSTPSNAEVKNEWSYTTIPLCACVVCARKTLHVMINTVRNFFTVL